MGGATHHHHTQHNTTQHNTTQHTETQGDTTHHNTTQHGCSLLPNPTSKTLTVHVLNSAIKVIKASWTFWYVRPRVRVNRVSLLDQTEAVLQSYEAPDLPCLYRAFLSG